MYPNDVKYCKKEVVLKLKLVFLEVKSQENQRGQR